MLGILAFLIAVVVLILIFIKIARREFRLSPAIIIAPFFIAAVCYALTYSIISSLCSRGTPIEYCQDNAISLGLTFIVPITVAISLIVILSKNGQMLKKEKSLKPLQKDDDNYISDDKIS